MSDKTGDINVKKLAEANCDWLIGIVLGDLNVEVIINRISHYHYFFPNRGRPQFAARGSWIKNVIILSKIRE